MYSEIFTYIPLVEAQPGFKQEPLLHIPKTVELGHDDWWMMIQLLCNEKLVFKLNYSISFQQPYYQETLQCYYMINNNHSRKNAQA